MMRLLRNKEVFCSMVAYLLFGGIFACIAFGMGGMRFALLVLLLTVILLCCHLFSNHVRYRRIAKLAAEIDRILHSEAFMSLAGSAEGELAILHSEIYKMTVRLREQQHLLLQEKTSLADSMADISHQLRTPLTSLNLLVELLAHSELSEEKRIQHCREMRELLTRLDWQITALLKLSRLDAGVVRFQPETMPLKHSLRTPAHPSPFPWSCAVRRFT